MLKVRIIRQDSELVANKVDFKSERFLYLCQSRTAISGAMLSYQLRKRQFGCFTRVFTVSSWVL